MKEKNAPKQKSARIQRFLKLSSQKVLYRAVFSNTKSFQRKMSNTFLVHCPEDKISIILDDL